MLNTIWVFMIALSIFCGALTGKLNEVALASTSSATDAVTLAIGLVGTMAFWLGMMKILENGGFLNLLSRALGPVMNRIFSDVPANHPAMSAMILNISSNMLGLANAATPFGIKAMQELDKLNPKKGTATNSMILFLAINTSNVAILPTGMIALRASLGSTSPGAILVTTFLATLFSTLVGITVCKIFEGKKVKLPVANRKTDKPKKSVSVKENKAQKRLINWVLIALFAFGLGYGFFDHATENGVWNAVRTVFTDWTLILLISGIVLFGQLKNVKVYDSIVEGGKDGFNVALRIIPFLVTILVAVGMLRASGAVDIFSTLVSPITQLIGLPSEALPMALLRPLSGSGAFGVAAEILKTHGPDTFIGYVVSTLQGSTETTFYVLAVYFGAVQVKNMRHALPCCLIADLAGILGSVWACLLFLS